MLLHNNTWKKYIMDYDELPVGFILVKSNFDFSQICSMCADFNYDVLEIYIGGHDALVFYDIREYRATVVYCENHAFEHKKYICSCFVD